MSKDSLPSNPEGERDEGTSMFRLCTRTKLESAERSRWGGQALVEYALILALLAIAAGVTLAMTGPAIGNVFCNVVHNVGGDTVNFRDGATCGGGDAPDLAAEGGRDDLFWGTVTWIAQNPQKETPFNND